jgi:hypothetical protein
LQLHQYDFALNLWDLSEPMGEYLTRHLFELRVPFSGERDRRYDPTRKELKIQAITNDIHVAPWAFVNKVLTPDEAGALAAKLGGFPIFTKSRQGGDSVGITDRSKCDSAQELSDQTRHWVAREGGCLIEKYIDGNEFSVLVVGNANHAIALDPVQYRFTRPDNHFLTEADKWDSWEPDHWQPCEDVDAAAVLQEQSQVRFLKKGLPIRLFPYQALQ